MRARFLFICGALLVIANVALGDGTYQRTKDGKTFVWNNHPKPGDQATWSGGRDREGYARGFGTLVWYTAEQESETGSAKPAVYARYWGNMLRGKLNGPVNVHSKRKTNHAIFADGSRRTRWAAGPAPSRAGTQWRAIIVQRSQGPDRRSEAGGPAAAGKLQSTENAQRSELDRHLTPNSESFREQAVQRPMAERQPEAPAEGPLVRRSEARGPAAPGKLQSEEGAQPSANFSTARTDVDESLRLLSWPPPFLRMRSINKGSAAAASMRANGRLSKEQVVDLADAAARSRGYDPTEYQRQELQYDPSDQAWSLVYDERSPEGGESGKHLSVAVGDKTKRTALVTGK